MPAPPPGEIARVARLVAAGAVLVTVLVVLATAGERPWQAVAAVLMISLLPYVAFVALARWADGAPTAEAVVLGGLVLAVFFAVGMYALAFVVDPGSRTLAAPVEVPLLQSAAVGLTGMGTAVAKWQARR